LDGSRCLPTSPIIVLLTVMNIKRRTSYIPRQKCPSLNIILLKSSYKKKSLAINCNIVIAVHRSHSLGVCWWRQHRFYDALTLAWLMWNWREKNPLKVASTLSTQLIASGPAWLTSERGISSTNGRRCDCNGLTAGGIVL
jgi:hypothetical protein